MMPLLTKQLVTIHPKEFDSNIKQIEEESGVEEESDKEEVRQIVSKKKMY